MNSAVGCKDSIVDSSVSFATWDCLATILINTKVIQKISKLRSEWTDIRKKCMLVDGQEIALCVYA